LINNKTILSKKRFSKHLYRKKAKKTNDEIKESNEKYDIVAKLRYNLGLEDARRQLFLNRGIENVLGTLTKKLEKVQNGGLTKFILRTVKMSIRLYLIEQKQKIGKINTVSNVRMILINTF
jgi:hypothetical protein